MITDSGFRASRLPQNLGTGQKDARPQHLGAGAGPADSQKKPYVEWSTSSVGVHLTRKLPFIGGPMGDSAARLPR
jgi:hypothetical protein